MTHYPAGSSHQRMGTWWHCSGRLFNFGELQFWTTVI